MTSNRHIIWLGIALAISACGNSGSDEPNAVESGTTDGGQVAESMTTEAAAIASTEIVPGLSMRIIREGSGTVAEVGNIAVVHYTGWLYEPTAALNRGTKFDSSVDRGQHFEFPLGGRRVIRGWDEGVVGMNIGELRELTIAPEMAYGDRQVGAVIPPGSTLVFEVELFDLKGSDGNSLSVE